MVVCSDEKQPRDAFEGIDAFFHAGTRASDLCVLSQCDSIIGTDSSFARTAAFLGNVPLYQVLDPGLSATPERFAKIDVLDQWDDNAAKSAAR